MAHVLVSKNRSNKEAHINCTRQQGKREDHTGTADGVAGQVLGP